MRQQKHRAAHCGNKELIAFVVHPGYPYSLRVTCRNSADFYDSLVQTDGGNKAARGMGLPQAPHTKKQSTDGILSLVSLFRTHRLGQIGLICVRLTTPPGRRLPVSFSM